MTKKVIVHAVARPEPDIRLYVLALIELARQLEAKNANGSVSVAGPAGSGGEA